MYLHVLEQLQTPSSTEALLVHEGIDLVVQLNLHVATHWRPSQSRASSCAPINQRDRSSAHVEGEFRTWRRQAPSSWGTGFLSHG